VSMVLVCGGGGVGYGVGLYGVGLYGVGLYGVGLLCVMYIVCVVC